MSSQEAPNRSTMFVGDFDFGPDSELQDVRTIREALERYGYDVTMSDDNSHFMVTREAATSGKVDR